MSRGWPAASTTNMENRVIFDQGFLPLVLDKPISNCKAAVPVLVRPGYFISPLPAISAEHSPIHHQGRRPMDDSNFLPNNKFSYEDVNTLYNLLNNNHLGILFYR
jgi:hypothetical protein